MTDRERQLIDFYFQHPPDPELGFMEFYMQDSADRVIKVWAHSLASDEEGEMRQVQRENGNGVFNAMGEVIGMPGWYRPWALYDNKEDCRNNTHILYSRWEQLRRIQQEESNDVHQRQ